MTSFRNPSMADIRALLRASRTIAVIGISDNPDRPSFGVSVSMRDFGYRILPVNPALTEWEGIPAYPTLAAAVQALGPDERIDIVNVFRRPAQVGDVVDAVPAARAAHVVAAAGRDQRTGRGTCRGRGHDGGDGPLHLRRPRVDA